GLGVPPRNDLVLVQVLEQLVALLARQLDQVAAVGRHAPDVVVLAGGAGLVQVHAVGPPERGDGHLELAAVEGLDVLHAALAVAALAHDDRPLVVLEAGRDDLAGAGAAAVDQADHFEVQVAALVPALVLLLLADARPNADDRPLVDEHVGNRHGAA